MKAMVHSPDWDTKLFHIFVGVLQWDLFAPYMFIICLEYELQTLIDQIKNVFTLKKVRRRRNTTETMTDVDYADD